MLTDDKTTIDWIMANLDITLDLLPREQAAEWHAQLQANPTACYAKALFGFESRRKRNHKQLKFPSEELHRFCDEFAQKIRLAANGMACDLHQPLFDLSGSNENGLRARKETPPDRLH